MAEREILLAILIASVIGGGIGARCFGASLWKGALAVAIGMVASIMIGYVFALKTYWLGFVLNLLIICIVGGAMGLTRRQIVMTYVVSLISATFVGAALHAVGWSS